MFSPLVAVVDEGILSLIVIAADDERSGAPYSPSPIIPTMIEPLHVVLHDFQIGFILYIISSNLSNYRAL